VKRFLGVAGFFCPDGPASDAVALPLLQLISLFFLSRVVFLFFLDFSLNSPRSSLSTHFVPDSRSRDIGFSEHFFDPCFRSVFF